MKEATEHSKFHQFQKLNFHENMKRVKTVTKKFVGYCWYFITIFIFFILGVLDILLAQKIFFVIFHNYKTTVYGNYKFLFYGCSNVIKLKLTYFVY